MRPFNVIEPKKPDLMKPSQKTQNALITVEPDGLVGIDSMDLRFDRAREILGGIKTTIRLNLAGQVMLGQELEALKIELGFKGSGRRKEKPQNAVFNSVPNNWKGWLKAELGISDDTGDRFINSFKIVRAKNEVEGGQPEAVRLLAAAPSTLSDEDRQKLGQIVNELLKENSQKELLQQLGIVNGTNSDANRAKASKKKPTPDDELLIASNHFRHICNEAIKFERLVTSSLHGSYFKGFLGMLPMTHENPTLIVTLPDLRARLEEALGGDLEKLLAAVNRMIDAKKTGDGATKADERKVRRKSNSRITK